MIEEDVGGALDPYIHIDIHETYSLSKVRGLPSLGLIRGRCGALQGMHY